MQIEEYPNWNLNIIKSLISIELHDNLFRERFCSKCTHAKREKRKCEEEIIGRTFCNKMIKSRENNYFIQELQLKEILESPFTLQTENLCEVLETIYSSNDRQWILIR